MTCRHYTLTLLPASLCLFQPFVLVCMRTAMGGAYLTLLNTIANMGVILPKTPLYAAMDWLTFSQCHDSKGILVKNLACPKKIRLLAGNSPCTNAGVCTHLFARDHFEAWLLLSDLACTLTAACRLSGLVP